MMKAELIELTEAVTVLDFLERAVDIVAHLALVVEDHEFAIIGGIRLPSGQGRGAGITCVGKGSP